MSYDILFIQKSINETWEEALKANEESALAVESSSPIASQPTRDRRDHIAALLHYVNPKLSRMDGSGFIELSDDESGLQISIYENEARITVPYHHSGRDARKQMTYAYKYAKIIERETGLIGYDGQRDVAFLQAEGTISESAEILSSTTKRIYQEELPESLDKPHKPWWKFWA